MTVGDAADGWPADRILGGGASHGCTFKDVAIIPAAQAAAEEAEKLTGRFSKNISLQTPIVGAALPSVTEERMAIALALSGGIGIIHKRQSIDSQAAMVKCVKEHETAFGLGPRTLGPRATVAEAEAIMNEVGCSCIPITDSGRLGGRLIGLVTRRDLDALEALGEATGSAKDKLMNAVMTKDVVHATEPITFRDAQALMKKAKVGKLPVINGERELVALICRGDGKRASRHPHASRDPNAQLLVAAAVAVDEERLGDGLGWDRARALVEAGVDALVVETDGGVSEATLAFVKRLKATYLTTDVLCGRVSSVRMAEDLCKDCDGLIVGAPQDAAYTAHSGMATAGISEASVLFQIARFARMSGVPVVAEGGVQDVQDLVKAFLLGAACVSPAPLLARTAESPGEVAYRGGVRIKLRRAPERGSGRDAWAPEVVEGAVVDAGCVEELLPHLLRALRRNLRTLGLRGLAEVHPALTSGAVRLELQRAPGLCGSPWMPPTSLQVRRLASSPLFDRW